MNKERLDVVVQQRFGVSRSKAQGMIQTGCIRDEADAPLLKPGVRIDPDATLHLREGPRFVSRGGDKLAHALELFAVNVRGKTAIDVGASTGGFTDCLLQHGAAKVYAVDVGYGQLAWKLRQDPRVAAIERCNIRELAPERLEEPPTFFTADCSFISLKHVLPPLLRLLGPEPEGVVLIKPQFEAGREQVGKGGVVRDPKVHERVVAEVLDFARSLGFQKTDAAPSPLLGPAGNREFLARLHAFDPDLHT